MVGTGGFEPLTSATRTQRSTRLNYVPLFNEHISTQKKIRLQAFFSSVRKKNYLYAKMVCMPIILYVKNNICIKKLTLLQIKCKTNRSEIVQGE